MVVNPFDPNPQDVKRWMYSDESWPEQDWDLFLANGRCDEVLLECARDLQCPRRDFALHCLYFLVGDVIYETRSVVRVAKVQEFLSSVGDKEDQELVDWKKESIELLSGEREFDYEYWCNHAFKRQDLESSATELGHS